MSCEPLKFWRHNHIPGMADRLRRCQLSWPASIINFWRSAAMLITSTVEICIQHLGQVEEMVFAARRSYASVVLGVVMLSVCPSVSPMRAPGRKYVGNFNVPVIHLLISALCECGLFVFLQRAQCSHCKRCISYSNSVCLSVRLSDAGIVSKRRHVARCSLHRWIAKYV